jgi:hypothetical protein
MADTINFDKNINESVQVGDELYYSDISSGTPTAPIKAGPNGATCTIEDIGKKYITVDSLVTGLNTGSDSFFMFLKPEHTDPSLPNGGYTNVSSLKGYYAEVSMTTDSTSKQELFAVGSEVTISSK